MTLKRIIAALKKAFTLPGRTWLTLAGLALCLAVTAACYHAGGGGDYGLRGLRRVLLYFPLIFAAGAALFAWLRSRGVKLILSADLLVFSVLAGGALSLITPGNPIFTAGHSLHISAPADKTVEIQAVYTAEGQALDPAAFETSGRWELNGTGLLSLAGGAGELSYQATQVGGLRVVFRANAQSGAAEVTWDGNHQSVNLYRAQDDTLTLELPGFTWPSLSPAQFAAALFLRLVHWLSFSVLALGLARLLHWQTVEKEDPFFYLFLLAFAAYFVVQAFMGAEVRSHGDTADYLGKGLLVVNGEWICCRRPFVTPLIYSLLGKDAQRITWFQLIYSIAAWGFLSLVTAWSLRHQALKRLSFFFVTLFGASWLVGLWQRTLLSDSIALSSFALLVGLWIIFLRKQTWAAAAGIIAVTVLWNFTRYTNNTLILMAAAGLALGMVILRGMRTRKLALILAAYLLIFMGGTVEVARNGGTTMPFGNVLLWRIIPDAQARDYFTRAGMPSIPAGTPLSRAKTAWDEGYAYLIGPEGADLREWAASKGQATFAAWLLENPQELFGVPWGDRDRLIGGWKLPGYYTPKGYEPGLGVRMNAAGFPQKADHLLLLLGVVTAFFCYRLARGGKVDGLWALLIFLAAAALPIVLLSFHGDPYDVERHTLAANLQLRLSAWLALFVTIDRLGDTERDAAGRKEAPSPAEVKSDD